MYCDVELVLPILTLTRFPEHKRDLISKRGMILYNFGCYAAIDNKL